MLTVEEVAAILKVQPLTVRQMFREGRIRGFKIGKAWRTTMPILEQDISCMSRGEAPPRLEQAASAAGVSAHHEDATPTRKRRLKPVTEAAEVAEAVAPEPTAVAAPPAPPAPAEVPAPIVVEPEEAPMAAEIPVTVDEPAATELPAAEDSPTETETPPAEDAAPGGKRKRKPAAEENTDQGLLF